MDYGYLILRITGFSKCEDGIVIMLKSPYIFRDIDWHICR